MNRDAQLGPGFAQARQASGVAVHRQLAHCCNLHGAVGPVPSKGFFFFLYLLKQMFLCLAEYEEKHFP